MACLLRQSLRRIHRFPFQQRLLSTSISGSSEPNSNYDFPSFLREVSEAIKQLDPCSSSFTYSFPPSSSNSPDNNGNSDEQLHLYKKLEQLRVRSVSFRNWHKNNFFKFLDESEVNKRAFEHETLKIETTYSSLFDVHFVRNAIATRTLLPPKSLKLLVNKLDTLIISYKRLKEMMVKDSEIKGAKIKLILASLEEIITDFSEIRKDLNQDDLWNELSKGLMRRKEWEVHRAEVFAARDKEDIAFVSKLIEHYSSMRRNVP